MATDKKTIRRVKLKHKIRKVVVGTSERPRLTVYRSNKGMYAQLVNDDKGVTVLAASSLEKEIAAKKVNKVEQAKLVGKFLAEKALKAGISVVVFDRNGYLYHGRVKSLADAAREAGLKI